MPGSHTAISHPDHPDVVTLRVICRYCQAEHYFDHLPKERYGSWMNGEHIQRAFPEMKPDDRELLISNTCGTCWNEMFPPEEPYRELTDAEEAAEEATWD